MTDKQRERLEFAKSHVEKWVENQIDRTAVIDSTAVIGDDGFGFAREVDGTYIKMPHAGNVVIDKYVEVRSFCTIDRGVTGSTFIGEGNKLDHHVHIAHNVQIGKYNTFANGCCIEGSCEIGSFNTFGSNVVVQRKVKVGSKVRVGSGTIITKDVPDRAVIVGNPFRILRFQDE